MTASNRAFVAILIAFASPVIMANASLRADSATTQPATTQSDSDTFVLTTKNYIVIIIDHRNDEYDITSDHVVYIGVSKRAGKIIRLIGSTWHHIDPTGAPGEMYGYIFKNGNIYYRVHVFGELEIVRSNGDVLLSEDGTWNNTP
jgi:hypothetical protein